jgi:hypothetical protein
MTELSGRGVSAPDVPDLIERPNREPVLTRAMLHLSGKQPALAVARNHGRLEARLLRDAEHLGIGDWSEWRHPSWS